MPNRSGGDKLSMSPKCTAGVSGQDASESDCADTGSDLEEFPLMPGLSAGAAIDRDG